MSNKRYKQFMGEDVSLKDYDFNFPADGIRDKIFPKGKFKQWKWVFIGDWKITNPILSNLGVRADQNKNQRSDDIGYDYEINGWVTTDFPPTIGTDGGIRDGRARIIAAIKKKQQWIPMAEYHFEETDTPIKDKVTDGLNGNAYHPPLTRTSMDDFIVAGMEMIGVGDIKRDKDELMHWLTNEANVGLRFPNTNGSGIYSNIVNKIITLTADKGSLTRVLDREDWLEWLKNTSFTGNSILYKAAKKQTDAKLMWCDHILPQIENELKVDIEKEGKWKIKKPTRIVIYTDKLTAEDSSGYVSNFVSDLNDLYTKSYSLIDSAMGSGLNKTAPSVKPFEIVGVCPNLHCGGQDEMFENYELVDVDNYINQGNPISKALKLVA